MYDVKIIKIGTATALNFITPSIPKITIPKLINAIIKLPTANGSPKNCSHNAPNPENIVLAEAIKKKQII